MPAPVILTPDLLEALATRLDGLAPAGREVWRPGLTDEEIDRLLVPLEIDLPGEARTWWRWRDGPRSGRRAVERVLWTEREPYSLATAAELYRVTRDGNAEFWGPHKFMEAMSGKPHILFDLGGVRGAPVPIRTQHDIEDPREVLPSIGALVTRWIELLDQGVFERLPDGVIMDDRTKLSREIVEMGIV